MNDFDYDVRQKKLIARGAAHMKRGSRSRKCSLPSDNLTAKQLANLSGPCVSIRMNSPITYTDFKRFPDDLKREYLLGLRDRYQVTQAAVAKMMQASTWSMCTWYKKLGIDATLPPMTADERKKNRERWEQFLLDGKEVADTAPTPEELDTDSGEEEPLEEMTPTQNTDPEPPGRVIRSFTEVQIGLVERPEDLLRILQNIQIPFPAEICLTIRREETI